MGWNSLWVSILRPLLLTNKLFCFRYIMQQPHNHPLLQMLSLSRQGPKHRPLCDHSWQHASRGLQVEGCCLSGADQPICYGDGLGGVATDCLVVDRAIGWCNSWVPCALERRLATWPERALLLWLMVSEMDGRPVVTEMSLFRMN